MHGIIFTSFRHFMRGRLGAARTAELLAGERPHSINETYDDREFLRLFDRMAEAIGADADELMRDFGSFTGERTFVLLYPSQYDDAGDTRTFLLRVEERIHELIRATVPDATPPELEVEPLGSDGVRIAYRSPRGLCMLLEGLVVGTARHYGELAQLEEVACLRRGDPSCLFEARFERVNGGRR